MKLEEIGFYSLSDKRAKKASVVSQMKRCEMIITGACNFKCPYCRGVSSIFGNDEEKELSLIDIMNNIDLWCKPIALENIRFSGGEPTLHPHIVAAVEYARKVGIKRIAISTNGSNDTSLYRQLIHCGCNDFSVSLDACCAEDGDKMSGGVKGSWETVIRNIETLSKYTYVTVGIVLTPENVSRLSDTINLAHSLGVADIRIISSAQYNESLLPYITSINPAIIEAHPILKYRINNMINGIEIRGLQKTDTHRCPLVLDDSVIASGYHFPCVIYMREGGAPIGSVGPSMRVSRAAWLYEHDTHKDPICKKNCLDVCRAYNNRYEEFRS